MHSFQSRLTTKSKFAIDSPWQPLILIVNIFIFIIFSMFLIPSWPSSITSSARANGNVVVAILPRAEKREYDLFELISIAWRLSRWTLPGFSQLSHRRITYDGAGDVQLKRQND